MAKIRFDFSLILEANLMSMSSTRFFCGYNKNASDHGKSEALSLMMEIRSNL